MQNTLDLIIKACRTIRQGAAIFGLLATMLLYSNITWAQIYAIPDFVNFPFEKDEFGNAKNIKTATKLDRAFLAGYQLFVKRNSSFNREETLRKLAQDLGLNFSEIEAAEQIFLSTVSGRIEWTEKSWRDLQHELGFRLEDFRRFHAHTVISAFVDIKKLEGLNMSIEAFKIGTAGVLTPLKQMFSDSSFRFSERWSLLAQFMNLPMTEEVERIYAQLWIFDLLKITDGATFEKNTVTRETDKFLQSFSEARRFQLVLWLIKNNLAPAPQGQTKNVKARDALAKKLGADLAVLLEKNKDKAELILKTFESLGDGFTNYLSSLEPAVPVLKPILHARGESYRLDKLLNDGSRALGRQVTDVLREGLASQRELDLLTKIDDEHFIDVVMAFADPSSKYASSTKTFQEGLFKMMREKSELLQPRLLSILRLLSVSQSNTPEIEKITFIIELSDLFRAGGLREQFESILLARSQHLLVMAANELDEKDQQIAFKLLDQVASLLPRAVFYKMLQDMKVEIVEDQTRTVTAFMAYGHIQPGEKETQIQRGLNNSKVYQRVLRYLNAQSEDSKVKSERVLPDNCQRLLE